MGLRGQVINLIRANLPDDRRQIGGVNHITIMQGDLIKDMVDSARVERRTSADDTMHVVALLQ